MKRLETDFFKEALADELIRLMKTDKYDDITVSEIAAKADVGRATYYRHFKSKDELLTYKFERLASEWINTLPEDLAYKELVIKCLSFIHENRTYTSILYNAGKKTILEEFFVATLVKGAESTYEAYRQTGSAYFFLGIIYSWIDRDYRETPEELTEIIEKILQNKMK